MKYFSTFDDFLNEGKKAEREPDVIKTMTLKLEPQKGSDLTFAPWYDARPITNEVRKYNKLDIKSVEIEIPNIAKVIYTSDFGKIEPLAPNVDEVEKFTNNWMNIWGYDGFSGEEPGAKSWYRPLEYWAVRMETIFKQCIRMAYIDLPKWPVKLSLEKPPTPEEVEKLTKSLGFTPSANRKYRERDWYDPTKDETDRYSWANSAPRYFGEVFDAPSQELQDAVDIVQKKAPKKLNVTITISPLKDKDK